MKTLLLPLLQKIPPKARVIAHRTFYYGIKGFNKIFFRRKGKAFTSPRFPRMGVGVHGEATLCRSRLSLYCTGKGIDIGCGPDPISSNAIPWDLPDHDSYNLSTIPDQELDFVFSSHCLEHMFFPSWALSEWLRVLKPGGHLVLYLPHPDYYPNIGWGANPDHCHDLYPEDVLRLARSTDYHFHVVHLKEFGPTWKCGEWGYDLVLRVQPPYIPPP